MRRAVCSTRRAERQYLINMCRAVCVAWRALSGDRGMHIAVYMYHTKNLSTRSKHTIVCILVHTYACARICAYNSQHVMACRIYISTVTETCIRMHARALVQMHCARLRKRIYIYACVLFNSVN